MPSTSGSEYTKGSRPVPCPTGCKQKTPRGIGDRGRGGGVGRGLGVGVALGVAAGVAVVVVSCAGLVTAQSKQAPIANIVVRLIAPAGKKLTAFLELGSA